MDEKIELFKELIEESNNIVFFGGARCINGKWYPRF